MSNREGNEILPDTLALQVLVFGASESEGGHFSATFRGWLAYTERARNLHKGVSRENRREIGVYEIIAFEQYRFASHLGQGVGEAIP